MEEIAAVVLAAGQSRRMGQPKMALPWGETTVIGRVVTVLHQAGIAEIRVVTGGARQQVEEALAGLPVQLVVNHSYADSGMTVSLQTGLASLPGPIQAALVVLGDQPQIQPATVAAVCSAHRQTAADLVIPSYQMRRGHPWLVVRSLWPAIRALEPGDTLRDFINDHRDQIHYLAVDDPSILLDLDTPQDYDSQRPPG